MVSLCSQVVSETIPDAVDHDYIARVGGVRLDPLTQVLDLRIDTAVIAVIGYPMEPVQELLAGEGLPRMLGQSHEQVKLGAFG